jgi:hypothetical protein
MRIWLSDPGPERLLPGFGFAVEKDSRPAWSEIGGILKGPQQQNHCGLSPCPRSSIGRIAAGHHFRGGQLFVGFLRSVRTLERVLRIE